ncbi:hypothetical protein GCM10010365_04160 [Streptomyces poonensis]|uniref:Uncharacterized protein n=1 Tax=Streptomyces poonensis TaxID=68255 RepID=A0A918P7Y8_9ACTN|nr:hypothetical protein GCM10010365_04160 [Streptomyces poonensis]GLJ88147.1 hypothetical protein GCM10017589_07470 [Streptomyces poonensis]
MIKTYPNVLGAGVPMFGSGFALHEFTLGEVRTFGNGRSCGRTAGGADAVGEVGGVRPREGAPDRVPQ